MSDKLHKLYDEVNKMLDHLEIKINNRNETNISFDWMVKYRVLREELKQRFRELYPELQQMKNITLPPRRPDYIDAPKPYVVGEEAYKAWYDNLNGTHHFGDLPLSMECFP